MLARDKVESRLAVRLRIWRHYLLNEILVLTLESYGEANFHSSGVGVSELAEYYA